MADIVQIVDAEGKSPGSSPTWFPIHATMASEALTFISILGAQSSGKSTLLNALFGTQFSVASRSSIASATTKGISAGLDVSNNLTVAFDVEGSDSRERGREGPAFHSKLASFVTAVSDAVIVNIWYHDLGRWDAAGYSLLADIFGEAVKLKDTDVDGSGFRTRLIFTLRDVDIEADTAALQDVLFKDVDDVFASKISSDATGTTDETSPSISDLFDLSFLALPHMKHNSSAFDDAVKKFAISLNSPSDLVKTEHSKGIPADGSSSFMRGLWESQYATSSTADATTPSVTEASRGTSVNSGASLMAAFKCNEAFSEALSEASQGMKSLRLNTLDAGEKVDDLGTKAANIMSEALSKYDLATDQYKEDAPIQARKRRELESIIDTQQQAMFMKQVQVLRENALTHFKSVTASDDMPSDLAFYTADSQFSKEAENAKRPGCSWNASQERTDLQNMMQEISTQRKRLLTSQVTAAQHQAHALQYLQMQQSQMNAIQAQAYGGGGAGQWNVGAAYRPPDTNINASLSYQQGRTNIQISMVPDESASLLGPNGFTSGVGPGNLGLSFNVGL